jgi:hypothetical protein
MVSNFEIATYRELKEKKTSDRLNLTVSLSKEYFISLTAPEEMHKRINE